MSEIEDGSKIKFAEQSQCFTVQACNNRYAICTKPFNLRKTVLYTIIDFVENIRGTENLIFSFGFETKKSCEEALERLISGETKVSYRNRIKLNIEKIYN